MAHTFILVGYAMYELLETLGVESVISIYCTVGESYSAKHFKEQVRVMLEDFAMTNKDYLDVHKLFTYLEAVKMDLCHKSPTKKKHTPKITPAACSRNSSSTSSSTSSSASSGANSFTSSSPPDDDTLVNENVSSYVTSLTNRPDGGEAEVAEGNTLTEAVV